MDGAVAARNGDVVEAPPVELQEEQWVFTTANGVVTKIERLDTLTSRRTELSAEEYAGLTASYYTAYYGAYYAGMWDYASSLASGDREAAQAHYEGMTQYFAAMTHA